MTAQPGGLTDDQRRQIKEVFVDVDFSIIESVLYFDGWSSYEECAGALIFLGIDGSLQVVHYGHCVMVKDNNRFEPRDISREEADELIKELEEASIGMPRTAR